MKILPLKHRCCKCGALRSDDELNGYDPITKDYSRAYCRKIANCQSKEIDELFKRVAEEQEPKT